MDHGGGLIVLRIIDPFVFDSGTYTCVVRSAFGTCNSRCTVVISEMVDVRHEDDTMPVFLKQPVPVVALHGSVVSFCAKVWPAHTQVKWSICEREMKETTRGILVRIDWPHFLERV